MKVIPKHKIPSVMRIMFPKFDHWGGRKRKRLIEFGKVDYKSMPDLPRQDNKDYINFGSGDGNGCSIRKPKKVRKTAWKRFYT